MKILAARVEWMKGWNNGPNLELLVDRIPQRSEHRYTKIPIRDRGDAMYVSELDAAVSFFFSDVADHHGYGGSSFDLTMVDSTVETIIGPWSSRAGSVNSMIDVEHHVLDVSMTESAVTFERGHTFSAGAVSLAAVKTALDMVQLGGGYWDQTYTGQVVEATMVRFPIGSRACLLMWRDDASVVGRRTISGSAHQMSALTSMDARTDIRYDPGVRLPDGTVMTKDPHTRQMVPLEDLIENRYVAVIG